jgi:hypothetical protein
MPVLDVFGLLPKCRELRGAYLVVTQNTHLLLNRVVLGAVLCDVCRYLLRGCRSLCSFNAGPEVGRATGYADRLQQGLGGSTQKLGLGCHGFADHGARQREFFTATTG